MQHTPAPGSCDMWLAPRLCFLLETRLVNASLHSLCLPPSQSLLCCSSSWQLCADCHLCVVLYLDQHQLSRGLAACHELHQPTTASIEQAPQQSLTCEVGQRQQQLRGVGVGSLVAMLDLHASMCPLTHMVDIWSTVQRCGRMSEQDVRACLTCTSSHARCRPWLRLPGRPPWSGGCATWPLPACTHTCPTCQHEHGMHPPCNSLGCVQCC